MLIPETGSVTEQLRVREIDDGEGRRLVWIIRRGSGSVLTWRRAQMVLLSAQGMDVGDRGFVIAASTKPLWKPSQCSPTRVTMCDWSSRRLGTWLARDRG